MWELLLYSCGLVVGIVVWLGRASIQCALLPLRLLGVVPWPSPHISVAGRVYHDASSLAYPFKFLFMHLLLQLRRMRRSIAPQFVDVLHEQWLEQTHSLEHAASVDTFYFNGFSMDGSAVVLRLARRVKRETEVWLAVRDTDSGALLQWPGHPDTRAVRDVGTGAGSMRVCAAGLLFECNEPMTRWTVAFDGPLRVAKILDGSSLTVGDFVWCSFSLVWNAVTEPFNFDTDLPQSALAAAIARQPFSGNFFKELQRGHQTHYEQWGALYGTLKVGERTCRDIALQGMRDHTYGARDWASFNRYIVHFVMLDNGACLHLTMVSMTTLSHFVTGYMFLPSGRKEAIVSCTSGLEDIGEDGNRPEEYSFSFTTSDGVVRHLTCNIVDTDLVFSMDEAVDAHEQIARYTIDSVEGWGCCEMLYRRPEVSPPVRSWADVEEVSDEKILDLTDVRCANISLAGGKGAQLAAVLEHGNNTSNAIHVPPGFCITTNMYSDFVMSCSKSNILNSLFSQLQSLSTDDKREPLLEEIRTTIMDETNNYATLDNELQSLLDVDVLYAVRSSAVSEDSASSASAGQLETIIGVKGELDSVRSAIRKCWASQFTERVISYRTARAIDCVGGMAVVVQQLLDAVAAGVCFTAHPLTADRSTIVINANYGIGDTVVDGSVTPDTFVVNRAIRSNEVQFDLQSQEIGSKERILRIIDGKAVYSSTSEQDAHQICLDAALAISVAKMAVACEQPLGGIPRDVEWAIDSNNCVWLLQARPITTAFPNVLPHLSLVNEFTNLLPDSKEWYTTCNIGEMFPGPATPLSASTFVRAIEYGMQDMCMRGGSNAFPAPMHHAAKMIPMYQCHPLISLTTLGCTYSRNLLGDKKGVELSICGQMQPQIDEQEIIKFHEPVSMLRKLRNALAMGYMLYTSKALIARVEQQLDNGFTVLDNSLSAQALYKRIDHYLFSEYFAAWRATVHYSASSGVFSQILLGILSEGKELKVEHYADVAQLLRDCSSVKSAEGVLPSNYIFLTNIIVSELMNELVASILADTTAIQLFTGSSIETALLWLREEADESISSLFQRLCAEHGHRCIKEAEMMTLPWCLDASTLVDTLQRMVTTLAELEQEPSCDKEPFDIDSIEFCSPVSMVGRTLLRWITPAARAAVRNRENGKSLAVKMHNCFKIAYHALSKKLEQDNTLPSADLMFFLTHYEIGRLLSSDRELLVARARCRQQLQPSFQRITLLPVFRGLPTPNLADASGNALQTDQKSKGATGASLSGTPVSCGVARGRALVVRTVEDARAMKKGDILVVPYTDVGWTVYFPLAAGLVTELGGMLSHGAVCAREFGIPCVVNVCGACSVFVTGDVVELDAAVGTISRLIAASVAE